MRVNWLCLLMLFGPVQAQDDPRAILRTRLEPAGPVLVGQPVRLHVDVLVTTWLTRAPVFPTFEMEGALVVLPDERSSNLTEQIEGQTWFGISRSYLIYAQEPRSYQIPAVEMTVLPGQAEGPVTLEFPQQSFLAQIPSEARGLGYFIATRNLQIEQELDRELGDLKVGDSIRRTITMNVDQAFSMFLPPVEFEEVEGLAVYPDPPQLEDRSADRIGFQGGERIDSATYVIQEEGDYELASFDVYWWDLKTGRLREASVPAVRFSAAPNPNQVQEISFPQEEVVDEPASEEESWLDLAGEWGGLLGLGVLILLVGTQVLRRLIRHLRRTVSERRRAYQSSEAAAFERVKQAARKGETGALVRHLYQWMDRVLPDDRIAVFSSLAGRDRQLDEQMAEVWADRYSGRGTGDAGKWSGSRLVQQMARLRRGITKTEPAGHKSETRLPELNPR